MKKSTSISEALQHLISNGYQLAESQMSSLPEEAILSDDWRLDSVHQIPPGQESRAKTLVIAVSSVRRHLKLVFVENLLPKSDFSPMTILRRLFPLNQRPGTLIHPAA